ncbi:MAG: acetolactate decarboxylase [Planctomycetes bacterium]|nr:acetolactate decarboxylase [Planctomycetota bacterium]
MKKFFGSRWCAGSTAAIVLGTMLPCSTGGWAGAEPATAAADHDRITQVSVINALLLGQFDGTVAFASLLADGDFGLGTLDRLDGELVVLDGRGYQIKSDGAVVEVGPQSMIPFAVVTPFDQDGEMACPAVDSLTELELQLDRALGHPNNFVAIRIEAELAAITLRSVHPQSKPYRPINTRKDFQSVWQRENLRGTFVGIRSPRWAEGITVPGYHWHFLAADRRSGGHVLNCHVRGGTVRYDVCGNWLVKLAESADFDSVDLSVDLREELLRVERLRGEPAIPASGGQSEPQ